MEELTPLAQYVPMTDNNFDSIKPTVFALDWPKRFKFGTKVCYHKDKVTARLWPSRDEHFENRQSRWRPLAAIGGKMLLLSECQLSGVDLGSCYDSNGSKPIPRVGNLAVGNGSQEVRQP